MRVKRKGGSAIIVMGVSGSGKSTVGRELAEGLSAPFLEGDEFQPSANVKKMRCGIALVDEDRWPWLDRIAQEFSAASEENTFVVGSCSALKRIYRNHLRERIPVPLLFVCLQANEQVLSARMKSRPGHYMPPALLSSQLATLELPDSDEFAFCLDSSKPIAYLLVQIITRLENRSG